MNMFGTVWDVPYVYTPDMLVDIHKDTLNVSYT